MILTMLAFLFHIINNWNNSMKPKISINVIGLTLCADLSIVIGLCVFV